MTTTSAHPPAGSGRQALAPLASSLGAWIFEGLVSCGASVAGVTMDEAGVAGGELAWTAEVPPRRRVPRSGKMHYRYPSWRHPNRRI